MAKRFLRMKAVQDKVPFSRAAIYALIAKGKFPKQVKLGLGGTASGWLESEIDEWIDQRLIESGRTPAKAA